MASYSHNFHNYQTMSDSSDYESTPSTIVDKSTTEPTIVQKSIGFATLSAMLFFAGILIYLAATSKLSSTPLSLSRSQQDQGTISSAISSSSSKQSFVLSSPMFLDGEELPANHTCKSRKGKEKGIGIPPPLQWKGVPEGTVELLLTMSDGTSGDSKWMVYNIPIGINQLNYENIPKEKTIELKKIQTDNNLSNLREDQITEDKKVQKEKAEKEKEKGKGKEETTEITHKEEKEKKVEKAENLVAIKNSDSTILKLDSSVDSTVKTVPNTIRTFLPYEEPCAKEKEHKEYSFHIYAFSRHITDADLSASISDKKTPQKVPSSPQSATTTSTTATASTTTASTTSSLSESSQGRGVLGKILREGSDPSSAPPAIVKIMEDSLLGEASLRTVFNADVAESVVHKVGKGVGHLTNHI